MIEDLDSKEIARRLKEKEGDSDLIILDVRTLPEYDAEKIGGSRLLDVTSPGFRSGLEQLDKHVTYLVYCRTGSRSRHAVMMMEQMGFDNILHLKHGIMEWIQEGLPVV